MAEVGAYYITVMPDMSKFTGSVKKAMGDSGASGGKSFSSSFVDIVKGSAIGTALGNMATSVGQKISDGLGAGIKRLDTIQNYPKVMKSLGYETEEASKSIKLIADHLDGLPTSTDQMVELTQAIADSTGDLDLATKAALGFNDMLLATGTSTADAASATAILNRILGKGSATTAQWYSLQQHIPAQMGAIAEKMLGAGKTTEDLRLALEKGTVSWNDFLQAIVDLDENGTEAMDSFYEQAKAMTGGIGTTLENIPNRIAAGWADIIDAIGREDIAATIDTMSYGVRDAMKRVGEHIRELKDKLADTKAFENFETIVGNIKERFGGLGDTIDGAMSTATTVIADFIDRALQWIVDHGEQIGTLVDGIQSLSAIALSALGEAFSQAVDTLSGIVEGALQWVLDNGEKIGDLLQGWADGFSVVADVLSDAFAAAADVLADCVAGSLQWILDHGELVGSILAGIATSLGLIAGYGAAAAVLTSVGTALQVISMVSVSGGLLVFFGDLGAAFALLAEGGGVLAPILGALGTAFAFLASPIGIAIVLVGLLAGALIYFFGFTETGQQMWSDFCNFLQETWNSIPGWFNDMVESTKQQWDQWAQDAAEWNENVRQTISDKWEEIKTNVSDATSSMVEDTRTKWEEWRTDVTDWNEGVRKAAQDKWDELNKGISEGISKTIEDTKSQWEQWRTDVAEWNEGIREKAVEKWDELGQGIVDKLNWAKGEIEGIVDWLKGIFDFEWKLPDIKLPSIDVSWTDYGFVKIPSFSVSWYAKGGVFDAATLIGVGEAGPEAVLPLNDRTYGEIAAGIASHGGTGGVVIKDCTFNVREEADIDRIADALSVRWLRDMGATA